MPSDRKPPPHRRKRDPLDRQVLGVLHRAPEQPDCECSHEAHPMKACPVKACPCSINRPKPDSDYGRQG